MTQATDVFLSYKAEDRARLAPLVAALEGEGLSVWWDAHIGGGSNWRQDIEEHLDSAKCVIVAWSKRSVGPEGEFVRDEAARAKRNKTFLPIRIDAVQSPLGFGEVQALPLKGWKGDRTDPRYLAIVNAVRGRVTGEHVPNYPVPHAETRISRRAVVAGGIGIGAVAAAGAGGWLLLKPDAANAKRIAVLPFANLSGDADQAYFADGIAEELRSSLSRMGLEVIGRASSVAVKDLDSKAAARNLGVAHILTGSVRRSPRLIRVSAQLVSGKDGVERWAQSYDRAPGDAIKIQTDIAENVARALSIKLGRAGRAALTLGGTADSMAQDLLLQSRRWIRDASSEEAAVRSIELANAALRRDPNYADAHVGKAFALASIAGYYSSSPVETARGLGIAHAAANRALQIAPTLGPAHAVLAFIEASRVNLRAANDHIRRAVALSPDDPEVLAIAGKLVAEISDGREGLALADRLLSLDPLNSRAYRRKSDILVLLRQYPAAIESARKALELAPDGFSARMSIGHSLSLLGRYAEARSEYAAIPSDDLIRLTGEAIIAARTGDSAAAERTIARMRPIHGVLGSYQYAEIYAQAGNRDRAFAELENALAAKDPGLAALRVDPFLDPIRGDPRYAALVKKLNFPG
jgi:serine/threonine-protein kinase